VEELIDIHSETGELVTGTRATYCDSNLTFPALQVQTQQVCNLLTPYILTREFEELYLATQKNEEGLMHRRVVTPSNHGGYIKYCDLSIVGVIDHSLAPKRGMRRSADPISDIDLLDAAAGRGEQILREAFAA
jgi:hypothetical protein